MTIRHNFHLLFCYASLSVVFVGCIHRHAESADPFLYMCRCEIGPIECQANNIVDALETIKVEGNRALFEKGSRFGFSVISRTCHIGDDDNGDHLKIGHGCDNNNHFVVPRASIHDTCVIMADYCGFIYFYQNGIIYMDRVKSKATSDCAAHRNSASSAEAKIGPFHFKYKSADEILYDIWTSGNAQLAKVGCENFFLISLYNEGDVKLGHTIDIDEGPLCVVMCKLAKALGLCAAYDDRCFYFCKYNTDFSKLHRSLVVISDKQNEN